MDEQLVALFEGDPHRSGLRLLARTRNQALVEYVRVWFSAERRRELSELEPAVRLVRTDAPAPRPEPEPAG